MKYAVIKLQGHQYKVSEGDEFVVDKLNTDKVSPEVLMIANGEKVQIGTPVLPKAKVTVKVLGEEKGKKLHVMKFRSKSRYRRKMGFRPQYSRIQIGKIS